MQLTVDKLTALRALRVHRRLGRPFPDSRCEQPSPDPSPQQRWTARVIPCERLALTAPPSAESPLEVVVPGPPERLRAAIFSCSVRSALPKGSFADLGGGLHIPCPELLFYELADKMPLMVHALLGFELCGSYARDPANPRHGEVVHGIAPVTTVEKISNYLDLLGDRPRALVARHSLRLVADNAWSAMEAIIALLAKAPAHRLGYELGEVALNVRHEAPDELVALGVHASRVPDIEVVGTRVGFNYDGALHLNLSDIERAAESGGDVGAAMDRVREKYHDDIRRNRELSAQGRVILPVVARDLYDPGALDAVMLEAAMAMAQDDGGAALGNVRYALHDGSLRRRRQELIWSLLPWKGGVAPKIAPDMGTIPMRTGSPSGDVFRPAFE